MGLAREAAHRRQRAHRLPRIRMAVVLALLLTAFTPDASAQEQPDEPAAIAAQTPEDAQGAISLEDLLDVVTTSTRRAQTQAQAPSIVTVITSQDIRRRGYRTVAETLRAVAGLATIDDLTYTHVGVRGLYAAPGASNAIMKVMINSQPVSFRPTSENLLGRELVPISIVKRIEVIRGPGSALYGANAFLGVVNIITFTGDDAGRGVAHQSASAHGVYTENESHQKLNGGAEMHAAGTSAAIAYLVAATAHYADRSGLPVPGALDIAQEGFQRIDPEAPAQWVGFPSPGWDRPTRRKLLDRSPSANDKERVGSVYGTLSYEPSSRTELVLDGHFQHADRGGEFLALSQLTHRNRVTYENWYARLRLKPRKQQDHGLALAGSLGVAGGSPTNQDRIVDPLAGETEMRRRMGYLALDGSLEATYAFAPTHVILAGIDSSLEHHDLFFAERLGAAAPSPSTPSDPGDKNFTNLGIYGQWTWEPTKALSTTVGVRLDHSGLVTCDSQQWDCIGRLKNQEVRVSSSQTVGGTITNRGIFQMSTRAAVVYALPVHEMHAKLIYGSSFLPPSPFQLFHDKFIITGSRGNPFLHPQSADTLEFLLGAAPLGGLSLSANTYYTAVDDKVVLVRERGGLIGRNADVSLAGLEANANYAHAGWLSAYVNVGYVAMMALRPKQRRGETDAEWEISAFNDEVSPGAFPRLSAHFGFNLHFPASHLNVSANGHFVGEREATLTNNHLFSPLNLHRTYKLHRYLVGDIVLSTVDLKLWGDRETTLSFAIHDAPGNYVEPGFAGIDIPSRGPQVQFEIAQEF